jgi:hypothetical protein
MVDRWIQAQWWVPSVGVLVYGQGPMTDRVFHTLYKA